MSAWIQTYLTCPLFDRTIVYDQSTTVSGDATHLTDGNLATTWRGGTDSSCYVTVDTCPAGEPALSGDYYAFWLSNYDVDFSGAIVELHSSENASDWNLASSGTWAALPEPLYFQEFDDEQGHRYYRLTFHDLPAVLELAQVFILTDRTPPRASQYPQYDLPRYFNRTNTVGTGAVYVSRMARNPMIESQRTYTTFTEAEADIFEAIFNDCAGRVFPFIYHEDTEDTPTPAGGPSRVCRMDRDIPQWSDVDSGVRRLTFKFTSLPWISDGYNF